MGQLLTQEYLPEDGPAFIDYMEDLIQKTEEMQEAGRVPQDENVRTFLDFWRTVVQRIRLDLRNPQTRPQKPHRTLIPMTASEYKAIWNLLDPINSLIVVLEVSGAIELHRTEAAMRVLKAVYRGDFE
jgi:hypothetical protein